MRDLNAEEILGFYKRENAVWFFDYNGDPTAPHAELTSGLCTDGYINSRKVFSNPEYAQRIVFEVAKRLWRLSVYPDWIIGSAYSAITFSYELARQMGARHGFVEKDPQNPKRMIWQGLDIPARATVLQAEELITILNTTREVRRAVVEGNPEPVHFLPYVATAIYRPSEFILPPPTAIVALVTHRIQTWSRDECPLHKQGSPAIRPKTKALWADLTRRA